MMKKILIVEDDMDAANVLEEYLRRDQFTTFIAGDGRRGLDLAASWHPDLILLDVMLPGMNGSEVLMALRKRSDVPVIMVTAIGDSPEKIGALRYGADDYIVKPYNPGEVVARVHAVLRRAQGVKEPKILEFERVRIDMEALTVTVRNSLEEYAVLELTPTELSLLTIFLQHPYKAFSRQYLFESCLPDSDALERVIDTHIYNLRRKLEAAGQSDVLINIRSIGYRFSN